MTVQQHKKLREILATAQECLPNFEHRFPASTELTPDWLHAEHEISKQVINQSIMEFFPKKTWGNLSSEEMFHAQLRLNLAKQVLVEFSNSEQTASKEIIPPLPTNLEDIDLLKWLLIDVWDVLGLTYLQCWVDDFIQQNKI
jgi:hypothetical protein